MSQIELTAKHCHNVLVVAITPRLTNGHVDVEGVKRNVEFLIEHGVDFLMPMCGTGLVYDANLDDYECVVGAFVDQAGGRALVVPGIGPGYGRSLEMGEIARSCGASGVMIMPIVGPASDNGVKAGLKTMARAVRLPVILYQRRLDIMPIDHVVELCRLDEIVGLKYAVDDLLAYSRIADGASPHSAMVCGMAEDPSIDYLKAGAVGFSSGMANFVPQMSLQLLHTYQAGHVDESERIRAKMLPFEDFRGEDAARYSSSALHAAMEYAGLQGGPVIPFAEPVADRDLSRLHGMMDILLEEERKLCAATFADANQK